MTLCLELAQKCSKEKKGEQRGWWAGMAGRARARLQTRVDGGDQGRVRDAEATATLSPRPASRRNGSSGSSSSSETMATPSVESSSSACQ